MFPINVGYLLTLNANRYPNKTALLYKGRRFSYREINDRVNRLAHSFMDLGITKGDKVGFMFPNCNQIVELLFALFKIGAIAVPLNHRLVSQEIKYLVDTAECKVFVYSDIYADKVAEVKQEFTTVKILISSGETFSGEYSYEQLCTHQDNTEPNVAVLGSDLSRIQFTGGTTGRSKGVMRTHESDIFQTISIMTQNKMGANPDEVVMVQCPLHHQGGMSWLLSAIATGAEFVFCDVFNPEDILKQIQDYKVTYLLLLPPVTYLRLYDVPNLKTFDLSSVKYVQMSAGGTSPDIIFKTYDAFPNCEVNYGWGQTESGAGTNIVLTRELVRTQPEKTKSIGKAMPLIELRIVDEEGKDVPVGEVGECIARGPSVMSGYYNQPELTAKALKDGWVSTGDMFRQDKEGYFYIMDRKKDMIKTGGENVFAQEVESVIRSHSAIQDCAVIGVPDPVLGEAVMAVVKLRTGCAITLEEIQELCKSQLSSYKKPRYVDFVDYFPIDSAGKIQKFRLREIYQAFPQNHLCKSS